uniref:Uncharacterized protein n=1 Tax=Peronospora matthiolae TaxID=2874970 RepID=A0AAV1T7G2_9STRA
MKATQQVTPSNRQAVRKARRRVGRVRASIAQLELRRAFAKDEAKCVAKILDGASAETAGVEHPDTCPIGREELYRHFVGPSTAPAPFDYDAAEGNEFRAVLNDFSVHTLGGDCFDGDISMDEVEDQLLRAAKASSPDHDGFGYDVFRRFARARSWYPFCMPHTSSVGCIGWCPCCGRWASFALSTRRVNRCSRPTGDRYAYSPLSTNSTAGCWHVGYRAG